MDGYFSHTQDKNRNKPFSRQGVHPGSELKKPSQRLLIENPFLADFSILKRIVDSTTDIFFILDPFTEAVTFLNAAVKRSLGLEQKDMQEIQKNFLKFLPSSDWQRLLQAFRQNKHTGDQPKEIEIRLRHQNGHFHFFTLSYSPQQYNPKGEVESFLCRCCEITNTKEHVKELTENKLKLQMALDGANMGIWSYDPINRTFEGDQRTNQIFGVTPGQNIGDVNPYFLRIHPEDRAHAILTAFNTLRRKGRFNHEFRVIPIQAGLVKHIAIMGEYIHDERTDSIKITGVCSDVTRHRIADNNLKTSESFLEESQRLAKIGCFDWDLILDKVNVTRQMYGLLNLKPEEDIRLDHFFKHIPPSSLPGVQKILMETIKHGGSFSHEFKFLTHTNSERHLWAQGKAIQNKAKRTTHLIGSIQDITDKKEKEKELHTQNLIIRSMLDNLPVVTLMIDKAGIIRSLLGSGLERIGLKENETVGQSIFEQYPPIAKYIRQVLKGESQHFTEEIEVNGQIFYFLSYYFYDKERELAIGFSIDTTSQRKTEEAFQQVSARNNELERVNHLMDMFVHAVAHDLKNPVNNLGMLSTLLREASTPQEQQEYFGALEKSVSRLKQTIKGLIEVIATENHRKLQARNVNIKKVVDQVKEEFAGLLQEKKACLLFTLKKSHIFYNEAFLASIIRNLLSNALKYADEQRVPEIEIYTERQNKYLLLRITDNGIGMDLSYIGDKLFSPFKRFSKQAEGTGIGLHLVKDIIEKNGGYIEVDSRPGKGSSFCCYLLPYQK